MKANGKRWKRNGRHLETRPWRTVAWRRRPVGALKSVLSKLFRGAQEAPELKVLRRSLVELQRRMPKLEGTESRPLQALNGSNRVPGHVYKPWSKQWLIAQSRRR